MGNARKGGVQAMSAGMSGIMHVGCGLTCMPSSENMNIVSRIRMTRLDMWGTARMNVEMIL